MEEHLILPRPVVDTKTRSVVSRFQKAVCYFILEALAPYQNHKAVFLRLWAEPLVFG